MHDSPLQVRQAVVSHEEHGVALGGEAALGRGGSGQHCCWLSLQGSRFLRCAIAIPDDTSILDCASCHMLLLKATRIHGGNVLGFAVAQSFEHSRRVEILSVSVCFSPSRCSQHISGATASALDHRTLNTDRLAPNTFDVNRFAFPRN